MLKGIKKFLLRTFQKGFEIFALPVLVTLALISRFVQKKIDVGLGPEPLINNVYHKRALKLYGYTAETFVSSVYFITNEFDVRADQLYRKLPSVLGFTIHYYLFVLSIFRYRCVYIYFNGGPLGLGSSWLWRLEPHLYKLAGVKVVVMPYGGDVQDLTRCTNLPFKHAMATDYPNFRLRQQIVAQHIDLWTRHAAHLISGCDWVDYMYHWDTLMLAHFSIDVDRWKPEPPTIQVDAPAELTKLRILHAPNHRTIKGTRFFIEAIDELIREGVPVELVIMERVPNTKIKEIMASVDVVADQLIIGWYAMFALEAMAMEKPVLCYLKQDYEELFILAGLINRDEIPIINCSPRTVKETIRDLALNKHKLSAIGQRSRKYVIRHHSTEAVGKVFDQINRLIGLMPATTSEHHV